MRLTDRVYVRFANRTENTGFVVSAERNPENATVGVSIEKHGSPRGSNGWSIHPNLMRVEVEVLRDLLTEVLDNWKATS